MSTKTPPSNQGPHSGPKRGEASFTLVETMMALGILVTMILSFLTVQGTSVQISSYNTRVSQATWLAKAVMAQIEYKWTVYDLKELKLAMNETEFSAELCPKAPPFECPFTFKLEIDDWALPLIDIMTGGIGGKDEDGEKQENPLAGLIKEQLKNYLGDELLKVAHVTVLWAAGAKQDRVELAYLLTAQQLLDSKIEGLNPPGAPGTGGLPPPKKTEKATVPPPGGPPPQDGQDGGGDGG